MDRLQWHAIDRIEQVGDQGDRRVGQGGHGDDTDAAHLHLAPDRVRRGGDQPAVDTLDQSVIVTDQGGATVDQAQGKVGLAAAAWPAQHDDAAINGHARCMQRL